MASGKTLKHLARKLARLSVEDEQISESKVRRILKILAERRPPHYRRLLRAYRTFLQRELRHRQALIEHAGALSDEKTIENLRDHISARYRRPIPITLRKTPTLLAGIRLSIGDDVYDATAAGRLATLNT